MWFSLSINLIHWFDSFSTVGLRNSLRVNKKVEGGKRAFTYSFSEKEREFAEGGRVCWRSLRKIFAQKSRDINAQKSRCFIFIYCWCFAQESREVRPAFIAPYGLHLMPRNWWYGLLYGFINSARVSGSFIAQKSRFFMDSTGCI